MTPGGIGAALGETDAWSRKWAALHDAASLAATLAGLDPEPAPPPIDPFPALARDAAPWLRGTAERAVEDMTAVMEPGIAALLSISARGADPRPAAEALWREFIEARAAVLALLAPRDA